MKETNGVIYILTNPSFSDYVKIGYADDVDLRIKQLNRSECTPFAFRLYAYYKVNARLTDMKLHAIIDKLNPDLRSIDTVDGKKRVREFYAMTPEDAYELFEAIAEINGLKDNLVFVAKSEEDIHQENEATEISAEVRERCSNFSFEKLGIPVGAILQFLNDDTITCEVVNARKVKYNGEITSISAIATKLLVNEGSSARYNGAHYFTYNGKRICDIRVEIEASE